MPIEGGVGLNILNDFRANIDRLTVLFCRTVIINDGDLHVAEVFRRILVGPKEERADEQRDGCQNGERDGENAQAVDFRVPPDQHARHDAFAVGGRAFPSRGEAPPFRPSRRGTRVFTVVGLVIRHGWPPRRREHGCADKQVCCPLGGGSWL